MVVILNIHLQIESALKDILKELRTLKVELVPKAGTSKDDQAACSVSRFTGGDGDNVDDIYSVLEGSALIPCLEVSSSSQRHCLQ